jgi:hypothetical protein
MRACVPTKSGSDEIGGTAAVQDPPGRPPELNAAGEPVAGSIRSPPTLRPAQMTRRLPNEALKRGLIR